MAEHSVSYLPLTNIFAGDIMMPHHGLVAQLGERTVRIRKVEGSIPFESTNKKATLTGGFLIGTVFTRRGSKAGTWRQSGGLSQPAWLFRRKAIPFESTI